MAFRFVLLILPALILAKIDVHFSGKFKKDATLLDVSFHGDDVGIITNTERNTFNLSDNNLKNMVAVHVGKRPNRVFLRGPTPLGNIYQSNGWQQVTRTLKPRSGKVVNISYEPVVIGERVYENESRKPKTYNVGFHAIVYNKVSSSWSMGGELSIDNLINYSIDLEIVEVGGEITFSYTSPWGKDTQQLYKIRVGPESSMEIIVQPRQSIVAQLHATKFNIQIQMEYEATLSGYTAVKYADKFRSHDYLAVDLVACMNSSELSNHKVSREIIDIGFIADSKIVIHH